jgi:hypothetical protein
MKPIPLHHPGVPTDPEPPDRLVELAGAVRSESVVQSGITTTRDGQWALFITVAADATVPLADIEVQAAGYPVVYEAEPTEPPRAGPAYPRRRRT